MVRTLAMTTAFVGGLGGMVLLPDAASTAPEAWGDQALQLTDETKIDAIFDEETRSFTAVVGESKPLSKTGPISSPMVELSGSKTV